MNKKLSFIRALKFLYPYIKRYRKNFTLFYLGWFLDGILTITFPISLGIMVDQIVYYQNKEAFLKISLVLVVMCMVSCILYFFIYAQHHYLMNMYTYAIKRDIFKHLQTMKPEILSNMNTGKNITIIQNYTQECMHFIIRNIIHSINRLLICAFVLFYIFRVNVSIGCIVMVSVPVSLLVSSKCGGKIKKNAELQNEYYGGYVGYIFEVLQGIQELKMLCAVKKVKYNFTEYHRKLFETSNKISVSTLTAQNIVNFTNLTIQMVMFGVTGYLAYHNSISMGALTVLLNFYLVLKTKVQELSSNFVEGYNRLSYIECIRNILSLPTEDDWKGKEKINIVKGNIMFRNVCFSYIPDKEVFNNLTLSIKSGEKFALAGASGCGKSTLASMLIGFYEPYSGAVEIDGKNLNNFSLKSIRKEIGVVSQEVLLFDGTIRYNLLLGNSNATNEKLEEVCRQAGILDFIENLPQKLDTVVGQEGIQLSGGQKQRIAIARIYLKQPKIIIFDEATSALDNENEEKIHREWMKALNGRTSIVIAHRLKSIMLCDRVGIIKNGQIKDIGKPEEMIKKNDTFKKLFAIMEG